MLPTRISLPETDRELIAGALLPLVATALDVSLRARQAHWSVRGPFFAPLHALFDEVYSGASEWADTLAERMAALGASVPAYPAALVKYSALPAASEAPLSALVAKDHLTAVADVLGALANAMREAVDATAKRDAVTSNMIVETVAAADKLLWMCESTLTA